MALVRYIAEFKILDKNEFFKIIWLWLLLDTWYKNELNILLIYKWSKENALGKALGLDAIIGDCDVLPKVKNKREKLILISTKKSL